MRRSGQRQTALTPDQAPAGRWPEPELIFTEERRVRSTSRPERESSLTSSYVTH